MKRKIGIVVGLLILLSGMAHAAGAIKAADANKKAKIVTCNAESDGRCTLSADIISILGTAISVGAGVIDAGTIRVTVATDDTVATDLTAIKTAVEIMDDWDETNRAAVNTIAGQVGVQGAAGAATALTQRMVLATDDLAVLSLGIMDDWDATHDSAASADGPQIMLEARSSRGTAVANGDSVRQAANLYGESIFAGYTWLTNSMRVDIINPLTESYLGVTLCDLSNITADAAAACGYWDMSGSRHFSLQIETSGTAPTDVLTVTLDCTNQSDGTAPASCAYQDLTQVLAGKASAIDTDDYWIVDVVVPFKYCRVWYTTSDTAGNDADLTVFLIKVW